MKQRLGHRRRAAAPRDLLVLDEPTNGLDPQGTREVRTLVRSLAADGTTLVVSSHLLAEIEQVCSHVGVMSAGRLVAQGTLAELGAGGAATLVLRTADHADAARVLAAAGLEPVGAEDGPLRAPLPGTTGVDGLVVWLVAAAVGVDGVEVRRDSLEDRFVALTGEGFEVVA